MLGKALTTAAAGNAAGEATYVEDVFSTYLYEGTGAAQTITNGIDLDGEGGMVWTKRRDSTTGAGPWIADTERGITKYSPTYATSTETDNTGGLSAVSSTGYTLGTFAGWNASGGEYVSWTFRKAPKFFDVVTYTGDGTSNRQIPHDLGSVPGFITVKARNFGSDPWYSFHRSLGSGTELRLSETDYAITPSTRWANTDPTDTYFVGDTAAINVSGRTYVAYLFAHNDGDGEFGPTADQDIIKCGSYTANTYPTSTEVELGFEPQWVLIKNADTTSDWSLIDVMRGAAVIPAENVANGKELEANSTDAEGGDTVVIYPTPTGFVVKSGLTSISGSGDNHIYIAIRRGPMKTPESGTEVFTPVIGNNLGSAGTAFDAGFPVDLVLRRVRASVADNLALDRLRGGKLLKTNSTDAESTNASFSFDSMEGLQFSSGNNFSTEIGWNFRRAPGFFDVVAYEGNGTAGRTVNHNLGVVPELMIVICRNPGGEYSPVYVAPLGNTTECFLQLANASQSTVGGDEAWNSTTPTSSVFSVSGNNRVNASGRTYIAYLFATLPGVSKVGSYTGNGTSQTIDCGFSTGARFVLLKETNGTSSWIVLDSERGINAGNDPILALNNTNAEYSGDDWIDPVSSGFSLPGAVFNGTGEEYIFLAIA